MTETYQKQLKQFVAFTWVPNPKEIGIGPSYQLNDTIISIRNMDMCCDAYLIYPEMTLAGNIHYHGILKIRDKVKWYKKVLPSFKHHGYVCIKNKDINDQWIEYIKKDWAVNRRVLNKRVPIAMKLKDKKPEYPCLTSPDINDKEYEIILDQLLKWVLDIEKQFTPCYGIVI